jgi:hypothetical protein
MMFREEQLIVSWVFMWQSMYLESCYKMRISSTNITSQTIYCENISAYYKHPVSLEIVLFVKQLWIPVMYKVQYNSLQRCNSISPNTMNSGIIKCEVNMNTIT